MESDDRLREIRERWAKASERNARYVPLAAASAPGDIAYLLAEIDRLRSLAQRVVDMNHHRYPDDPDIHMAIGELEKLLYSTAGYDHG